MISKTVNKIIWTVHAKEKMRFYRLSQSRILRILRYPKRKEIGVARNTIAAMQSAGSKKYPYEIWVMYQIKTQNAKCKTQNLTIISAWRYPGVSPLRQPPIQEDDIKFWQ